MSCVGWGHVWRERERERGRKKERERKREKVRSVGVEYVRRVVCEWSGVREREKGRERERERGRKRARERKRESERVQRRRCVVWTVNELSACVEFEGCLLWGASVRYVRVQCVLHW